MITLDNVQLAAEGALATFVDDEVLPAGHFGGAVILEGQTMPKVFLFEGEQDDPNAVVKGRIEYIREDDSMVAYGYEGNGLTGGINLGVAQSYKEAFAAMVQA